MNNTPQTALKEPVHPPLISTQIGELEITNENTVYFRYGIPGFETLTKFLIADFKDFSPFKVLQSLEDPEVTLLVLDINLIETSFRLKIPKTDLRKINISGNGYDQNVDVFVVLKYDKAAKKFTANIKAPIIINTQEQIGCQVILDDDLSVHYPLTPV